MIDSRVDIHPDAKIADNVSIGPWTRIGAGVEIGAGTIIASHVVVEGPTTIGRDNHIFQFASVGAISQDKKCKDDKTRLEIGDRNIIREFCTLNRGTVGGGGVTRMGDDNLLMAYVHIAHDCILGSHITMANNASLAGHVIVEDYVGLGGFTGVHQFCRLGAYSFIAKAMVTKDVLPYVLVSGPDVHTFGLNSVGLKRQGFSEKTLAVLQQAYKLIFKKGLTAQEALAALAPLAETEPAVSRLIDNLTISERGIVR